MFICSVFRRDIFAHGIIRCCILGCGILRCDIVSRILSSISNDILSYSNLFAPLTGGIRTGGAGHRRYSLPRQSRHHRPHLEEACRTHAHPRGPGKGGGQNWEKKTLFHILFSTLFFRLLFFPVFFQGFFSSLFSSPLLNISFPLLPHFFSHSFSFFHNILSSFPHFLLIFFLF